MEPTNTIPTAIATMAMPMPAPTTTTNTANGDTVLMGMSTMAMTFFPSTTTPLFWDWWTPRSAAAYAATCVFLIGLAAATRVFVAAQPALDAWASRHISSHRPWSRHRYQQPQHDGGRLLAGQEKVGVEGEGDDLGPEIVSSGLEGGATTSGARRWWGGAALGLRLWKAVCEVVLVFLGYLL